MKILPTLLLLLITINPLSCFSQVAIGSGTIPESGALLEMKEKDIQVPNKDDITSLTNSAKGVLFPKVSLKAYNKLTPLYGGSDDGNNNWTDDATDEQKLLATGMVVFNTNSEAYALNEGMYVWHIDRWLKMSSDDGLAQFDAIYCENIVPHGAYVTGTPTGEDNYMEITLNVIKTGSYSISIFSDNGYSFYVSGKAIEPGNIVVRVPAQGIPVNEGLDNLTVTGVILSESCIPTINVLPAIGSYSLVCSSITAKGDYYKNVALDGTNMINLNVNVTKKGSYYVYTEPLNGVSFSGSGTFTTTGTQQIKLVGTGAPTVNEDFTINVIANTVSGSSQCSVNIPIILPSMTYGIIGNNVWSWAAAPRTNALSKFKPDGALKIKSFTSLFSTPNVGEATNYLTNGVNGKFPDVVLYFAYNAEPNDALIQALLKYINAGGCLLYGSADNSQAAVQLLMNGLFGSGVVKVAAQTGGGDDNVYQIINDSSDPVVNGAFGNLSGQYWGEDNGSNNSVVMQNLPPNSVQICSAASTTKTTINPSYSIVWYNNAKNFVYFGDSTGASYNDTSTNSYPTVINADGIPVSKMYGPGGANNRYIYNAALEFNSVSFLIQKAAVSGINF